MRSYTIVNKDEYKDICQRVLDDVFIKITDNCSRSYLFHPVSATPVPRQKFDRQAASISRKIRSPRTNRYRWSTISKINFQNLAIELEEVSKNFFWKLYEYIYQSKELESLNESFQYGHSSLRYHLLLIANLIVQDF
ncbi:MAG: hypothetical protein ACXADY_18955 [Candidatus Hodarchaeales archaeon]